MAMSARPRSETGHVLLPAFDASQEGVFVLPVATKQNLLSWTFGRGTVIWRIWPAVLLHTLFAAAVVSISLRTRIHLGIPNVMLTLLGVVIGFVISYRASSGYDRYWQGRSAWGDMARTARTFSRLLWIHVPLKIAPIQVDANGKSTEIDVAIARRIMSEKRMALDLIEGFVVAVKHHLRGEVGIYYEDLYPLVKPLHEHDHHNVSKKQPVVEISEVSSPRDLHPEALAFNFALPSSSSSTPIRQETFNPVVPPINAYGTFMPPPLHHSQSISSFTSVSSDAHEGHPLLPGAVPERTATRGLLGDVSSDLVPFSQFFRTIGWALRIRGRARAVDVDEEVGGIQRRWNGDGANGTPAEENGYGDLGGDGQEGDREEDPHPHRARIKAAVRETGDRLGITHVKHRPRIAGGGENLPIEILRSLSVWLSVMDDRGVVPGNALGGMFGCISSFEDSLSALERILTTPLPFVYSVHIRTVWVYLFFLPFQLVDLFAWYAIPGVGIAAFIYLGLIAAGEEIEQPFGYDENDIDLDFFCRAIIHADIERVKRIACPNVFLGAHHDREGAHNAIRAAHDIAVDPETKIDAVFGGGRHI